MVNLSCWAPTRRFLGVRPTCKFSATRGHCQAAQAELTDQAAAIGRAHRHLVRSSGSKRLAELEVGLHTESVEDLREERPRRRGEHDIDDVVVVETLGSQPVRVGPP